MIFRVLWPFLALCILSGCREKYVFNPRTVENDSGEAVIRALFAECPFANEAQAMTVVAGETQDPVSDEFLNRFANLGPRLLKHSQVTVRGVGGKARVQEIKPNKDPGELVLLLQITELKSDGNSEEAIAAWAYKDDMLRRRYKIAAADGKSKKPVVTAGDVLEKKTASNADATPVK